MKCHLHSWMSVDDLFEEESSTIPKNTPAKSNLDFLTKIYEIIGRNSENNDLKEPSIFPKM